MDEDLGRHRRGCGQPAEIPGAASGPAGIPGSPAACATLWGPVGAGERIDCQTITLPVRRRDTLMAEALNLASGVPAAAIRETTVAGYQGVLFFRGLAVS